jgi:IS1 family transposase
MNILPFEKQIECIAALCEGMSIRAVERLTGVHRDTIMRLGARVGTDCAALHHEMFQNLHVDLIELDEIWGFVGKKRRQMTKRDGRDKGDQYTFLALDRTNKAILSFYTGKRDKESTYTFLHDLRGRIVNAPQISSDAMSHYAEAMRDTFGNQVHYAQVVKRYVGEPPVNAARRYSPGVVVAVKKQRVIGSPDRAMVSTSMIERQNLTLRMSQRRFTRLTNGFSKKIENHCAAVALYVGHYNLCRVHETVGMTPAMALGITDRVWSIGELIENAALGGEEPIGRQAGPFQVIDGGLGRS